MTESVIDKQRRSFDNLVEEGVYSGDFEHAPKAKSFVGAVLSAVLPRLPRRRPLTLLDCGCGTGAWIAFLGSALQEAGVDEIRCCGFDLSGRMVEVARDKLAGLVEAQDLHAGDILEETSYRFDGPDAGFDLIFAYDVVQQLPRRRQYEACEMMAKRLAPEGLALIFDNDCHSKFGRRMARRKFFTRYCGLKLVPRYYCNAAYPPLERFRQRLEAASWDTAMHIRPDRVKRALVVGQQSSGQADAKNRGSF